MLDNLPAYMVKQVKVYEKQTEENRFLKLNTGHKNLVMDVNLKRQYQIGWIANAEGGIGTEGRYMGRAFALRFTPQSRLSFFANLNNVNESRKPGENNDWTPADIGGGKDAAKSFGLDYQVKDVDMHYTLNGDAKVEHLDRDHHTEQAGENFLAQGNTFSRAIAQDYSCNTSLNTSHNFQLRWTDMEVDIRPNASYRKWDNHGYGATATFAEDPGNYIGTGLLDSIMAPQAGNLLRRIAMNRTLTEYYNKGNEWGTSLNIDARYRLPYTNNGLFVSLAGDFSDRKEDRFDHYRLDYPSLPDAATDYRNRWNRNHPDRNGGYSANIKYHHNIDLIFHIKPSYSFSQRFTNRDFALYRLDRLSGWGTDSNQPLGALPSETEHLRQSLDAQNSEFYDQIENVHRPCLELAYSKPIKGNTFEISATLPLNIVNRHMDYRRGAIDTTFSRNATFFEPTLTVIRDQKRGSRRYQFEYNLQSSMPSLASLITLPNDANPLNVTLGNPNLKNRHTHTVKFVYRDYFKKSQSRINADINYSVTQNATAWGYSYDRTTGVRTSRPENVNGNYAIWGGLYYYRPLDKAQRLDLNTFTTAQFYNNVDLADVENAPNSLRSTVRSLFFNETLQMNYRLDRVQLGAKVNVGWTHAASSRPGFNTVNAADLTYGLSARIELPWQMQFYTDLNLYSHRGYEDNGMNTDDLVWNARLSKRVWSGRLTFILDGFDILQNLSNITKSLNAQGRTETYRNVIPRYFMLHAVYRLNIKPKKLPGE